MDKRGMQDFDLMVEFVIAHITFCAKVSQMEPSM